MHLANNRHETTGFILFIRVHRRINASMKREAQERLKWRWSKPANLTVNGPVKYAVEKRKLFVMDEDGREHEMEIVKKTLRQSADPSKR